MQGKLPPDEIIVFEMLSEEYGWTPDQIRALRQEELRAYIEIISQKRRIRQASQ